MFQLLLGAAAACVPVRGENYMVDPVLFVAYCLIIIIENT